MIADILHKIAQAEAPAQHNFYPRPSLAGPERCIRQMVYWGLGFAPQPLPGRTFHVFDDGNWHEELVAEWIRKSSFQIHSEQLELNCLEPMKKGHIDGIITDVLGVDRLWENKALNHFTFERFWKGGEYPLDYFTQMAIYTEAIQRELNPDLKESILLIKNKNTSQYMEYLCSYDRANDELLVMEKSHSTGETEKIDMAIPLIVTNAVEKFNQALDYIKRKTLPKRQYDMDHWRCQYCQYHQVCWENYAEEFEQMQTNAALDEMADTIRYKNETAAHRLDMEKEEKKIKKQIIDYLKEHEIRQGKAGEYAIELKLVQGERTDKSKIPPEAKAPYQYEKLTIRKLKEAL